jgi:hypothetical protein
MEREKRSRFNLTAGQSFSDCDLMGDRPWFRSRVWCSHLFEYQVSCLEEKRSPQMGLVSHSILLWLNLRDSGPFYQEVQTIMYQSSQSSCAHYLIAVAGGSDIPTLEQMGPGKATGIVLGSFAASLLISYVFFMPYFYRRYVFSSKF